MKFRVVVLPEARDDIVDIYLYVAENNSVMRADSLLSNLEQTCLSLNHSPQRGHAVPELKRINVENFREIHYKPYRIIYQIIEKTVYVHAVLDGRRDLQEFLEMRIFR
ncbi:MAG: type II toxin-antitoxin system RelE/ParE family toxin [Chitinivibrionales bacterium]|nr:type II toxin-antitoxin system RelE/ParE family toxin [Chitinivibrionales bacterium]